MGKKHKKHKLEKKDASGSEAMELEASSDQAQSSDKAEKPLKLVLKVGHQEAGGDGFSSAPPEEKSKHKHKKKKKKKEPKERDREDGSGSQKRSHQEEPAGDAVAVPTEEPPQKKLCTDTDGAASGNVSGTDSTDERMHRSPRSCTIRHDDGAILRQCLQYLQKILQNKDVNGFFAFPVTDSIAPGYSSIILNPMDFSTMEAKIENNEYRNVMEYKKDFMTMCNNATTYNRPETVYYKEAKRLLHIGLKQLSKDRLLTLKKTQSWLANLTLAEIGIDEQGKVLEEMPPIAEEQKAKEKPKSKSSKTVQSPFEPFPDMLTPEEILAQAQAASKEARQELSLRKPKTDFAFFRRNKKGVTTMNIMNQDNDGIVSETERIVTLGELVGKLPAGAGTGALAGFKEDKRNKVTPITYVNYGPFSSFAPQYDSSFSNVSKEESDLLLATYGDETGVQYAKSVQSFVDSAGDYAVKMVNNLLDMLTKGQHTRTNMMLEQQRRLEEQRAAEESESNADAPATPSEKTEAQSPAASSVTAETEEEDPIQKRLNTTAELIGDLHRTQEARLSQQPPSHLAHCQGPSEREMQLAAKVTEGLADLSRDATPSDLVSVQSLRSAMGISSNPLTSPSSAQDEESMAEDVQADDTLEENLPSAGTASESMGASQATEEEEDGDEDEEVGEGVSVHDGTAEEGGLETGETADEDEGVLSGEAADLSEFFPSPSPADVSMEDTT